MARQPSGASLREGANEAPKDNNILLFPHLWDGSTTPARPMGAAAPLPPDDFPRPMSCAELSERGAQLDVTDEMVFDVAATVVMLQRCQAGHLTPAEAIDSALLRLSQWLGKAGQ